MKKYVCLLVLLLMAFTSAVADVSEITWGMSKEDVISIMGSQYQEDSTAFPGSTVVGYDNQPISDFTMPLLFFFRENGLCAKMYTSDTKNGSTVYTYLAEALDIKYGSSIDDKDAIVDAFILLGQDSLANTIKDNYEAFKNKVSLKSWSNEDVNIVLLHVNQDNTATMLLYFKKDALEDGKTYNFNGL